jgi:opacity protein-like surface antigen
MRIILGVAILSAALMGARAPAACPAEITGGVGGGLAMPISHLNGPFDPDFSVTGWASGKALGLLAWRTEAGHDRLRLAGDIRTACRAAQLKCEVHLDLTYVAGGLELGADRDNDVAPYGYVTLGLYHVGAGAAVTNPRDPESVITGSAAENDFGVAAGAGVRLKLGKRWGVAGEGRYTGFTFALGDFTWGSLLTATAHAWIRF